MLKIVSKLLIFINLQESNLTNLSKLVAETLASVAYGVSKNFRENLILIQFRMSHQLVELQSPTSTPASGALRRSPRKHVEMSLSPTERPTPTPTAKRSATCWNFFNAPSNNDELSLLTCYYCKANFKYNKNSSSNLTKHCKSKHLRLWNKFEADAANGSADDTTSSSQLVQEVINSSLSKMALKPVYSEKKAHELLAKFVIEDDQSFRVYC